MGSVWETCKLAIGKNYPLQLQKQDVAAVQVILAVVDPLLRRYWQKKINGAVDYLLTRLLEYQERQGETSVDVVAEAAREGQAARREAEALLASLVDRMSCPPSARLVEALEGASRDLLDTGALALGLIGIASQSSPRLPILAQREVHLLLQGRLAPGSRQREVLTGLITDYLQDRELRDAVRAGTQAVPEARRLAVVWRQDIRDALGIRWQSWGGPVVDAWSYRWHNIGRFTAGVASGVKRWRARNPLDTRTTPFCRWVHGRIVSVRRMQRQLNAYLQAITDSQVPAWSVSGTSPHPRERTPASVTSSSGRASPHTTSGVGRSLCLRSSISRTTSDLKYRRSGLVILQRWTNQSGNTQVWITFVRDLDG